MKKDLIIKKSGDSVKMALLENGALMELHEQKLNDEFQVGDLYLGRIKRLMPGLNAAFVKIGHPKDAFLHYTDLSPKLRSVKTFTELVRKGQLKKPGLEGFRILPDIQKNGKINKVFNKRDLILVQVLKEPISTKGPRLTCEITIAGHNLVLLPFTETLSISKKIDSKEERSRLKKLVESIKPVNFGVIIRTAAKDKKVAELHEELLALQAKWEKLKENMRTAEVPSKVLSEMDKTNSFLRDAISEDFNKVVTDDEALYNNLSSYLKRIKPQNANVVQHYKKKDDILETFGVKRQIKKAFSKTPTMPSGAYLVIEGTEAMHVIDVNSGPKTKRMDQEEAAITVNMEAAKEIARQLRLRDLGGLIVIDFIDMRNRDNKNKLHKAMKDFMAKDRAQHTVLRLSRFGLMQITRQRVKPEVKINTSEVCPTCQGTGEVKPSILITDEIEDSLARLIANHPDQKLKIVTHPYVEAYINRGFWKNLRKQWSKEYKRKLVVESSLDYGFNEFRFFDMHDDEIRV